MNFSRSFVRVTSMPAFSLGAAGVSMSAGSALLICKMVRKPGLAPGPSASQAEMLLLHHNPEGKSEGRIPKFEGNPKLEDRKNEKANSGFRLRVGFGFRPSDFGFSKWCSHVDLHHELP